MGPKSQFCATEHGKARFQQHEYHKPIGVEYAGKVTAGVRERVVCGLTNAAHLHRNAKQGGTLSFQVLERGNEEREDSCAAGARVSPSSVKTSWLFQTLRINSASPQNLCVCRQDP